MCLFLPFSQKILIGKLGKIFFKKGYYLYIGKAFGPGGLNARIKRHLNKNTSKRWHLDYLKEFSELIFIGVIEGIDYECYLAQILVKDFSYIKNFGSSDCKCKSHLFFNNCWQDFIQKIKKAGINPPVLFNIN